LHAYEGSSVSLFCFHGYHVKLCYPNYASLQGKEFGIEVYDG